MTHGTIYQPQYLSMFQLISQKMYSRTDKATMKYKENTRTILVGGKQLAVLLRKCGHGFKNFIE